MEYVLSLYTAEYRTEQLYFISHKIWVKIPYLNFFFFA